MKLIRLKLLTDFRGLQKGFEINFSNPNKTDKIDPICFVGPNGGGKSNVLELLSEIFYYLELIHLNYSGDDIRLNIRDFAFELEYRLKSPYKDEYPKVKVTKSSNGNARFYVWKKNKYVREKNDNQRKQLLPVKIIGYSSGMNELISNPFIKMQYHYFNDYLKVIKTSSATEDSRLIYMDYHSNSAIMIANFLMNGDEKLEVLNERLQLTDVASFRINICYKDHDGKPVELAKILERQIDQLRRCATCMNDRRDKDEKSLTLDYFVTSETKKAFRHYFNTPFELFRVFYLLGLLNIHMIQPNQRKAVREADREVNISARIPRPPHDKFVFRIDQIRVKKRGVSSSIPYKSISDGEHQFMHVVGTAMMMEDDNVLFLLDEPETHFNPEWRSKLVNTLNKVTIKEKKNSGEIIRRQQEFIITTHSPFILSDCHTHNVFVFERNKENKVEKRQLDIQTYGASSDVLLEKVFNKENTISDMALDDIQKLMKEKPRTLEEIDKIKAKARLLGESPEKFLFFSHLNRLSKQIK